MALRLPSTTEKVFQLIKSDPEGKTTVTIRQATQKAVAALGDLISRIDRQAGADTYVTYFNPAEAQMLQAYHTIVACDIEDAAGAPLFPSKDSAHGRVLAMDKEKFRAAWESLPPEWASEIIDFVLEMNPMWGFSGEGKE